MADFNQTRSRLNDSRSQKEEDRLKLFIQRENLKKIKREKEHLGRIFNENNNEHIARLRELENIEAEVESNVKQSKVDYENSIEFEEGLFTDFAAFTDPREQINQLSDDYPILLMPLRLETRFKKVEEDGRMRDQLWLRIYPDDCAIDTFEPFLSETEIKNTKAYWSQFWQAGGIEEQERAAWKALVASHGSGRASWIITKSDFKPLNSDQKPDKDEKEDIILIIATSNPPPENDRPDILNYWKNYWLADGNEVEQDAAFEELKNIIGEEQAVNVVENYVPDNIDVTPNPPLGRSNVTLQAQFLILPDSEELDSTQTTWTQAPHTDIMPDRFVVIGYNEDDDENLEVTLSELLAPVRSPVIVGPDPSAEPGEQFNQEDGNLTVGEDMKWMVDFEEAVQKGFGYKINLNTQQAEDGFDRLVVLGVKLSADEQKGQELLENLIEHHHISKKGFNVLPQGTPTNNTEEKSSGHQSVDNADESFDRLKAGKLFDIESDWNLKKDGQWLAECLGIDYELMQQIPNSDSTDQLEVRMMNTALWPATLGYMMETMMQPVFSDEDIEKTRSFFNTFVSGRGMIPAIKIGKQPYGILPATAFSKLGGLNDNDIDLSSRAFVRFEGGQSYLQKLYQILTGIDEDWSSIYDDISYVGKPGDAHQILLDVVGLNPSSVEFYQRFAESFDEYFNRLNLMDLGDDVLSIIKEWINKSEFELLEKYGYNEDEIPDILEKLFLQDEELLKGPVIDDRPLSETDKIRAYTPAPENENYIEWLIDAAGASHDTLRRQEGFIDDKPPRALLYLWLHHALDLSYVETGLFLLRRAEIITDNQVRAFKRDPAFLHVQKNVKDSESKWRYLYSAEPRITNSSDLLIGDYIPSIINKDVATAYLSQQLNALNYLKDVPTARLERVFAEHIDCCTYRLDAWKAGLVHYQLANMRFGQRGTDLSIAETEGYENGIYLGAYGWLEDVQSEEKQLTIKDDLDSELDEIFNENAETPLFKDDKNGGYISAPSLNHAVTAAVLRNGYLENANSENPETLAVNLSSERVRKALSLIEGMRQGQGLSELLGYHLERGLHDHHPGVELDFYIYQLRKAFPLIGDHFKETKTDEDVPIEAIEARNVVDGLALINHIKNASSADKEYPFGKDLAATDTAAQSDAINKEVQIITNLNDAVADVAISEGVFQIVQGNYERGAAVMDTYGKGHFPPVPDVVKTPRSGINITHRTGIQFESGVSHLSSPNSTDMTVRAQAEPAINKWLNSILPDEEDIACAFQYIDHADNLIEGTVSPKDLGLQPVDLLYMVSADNEQAMTALDDLIVHHIVNIESLRPDTEITINYTERIPDKINFFELNALMKSLRALILQSRPLKAEDVARPIDVEENGTEVFLDVARFDSVYDNAVDIQDDLNIYLSNIEALVADPVANESQIFNQIDPLGNDLADLLVRGAMFGFPETGVGFIHAGIKTIFRGLIKKLQELITRWDDHITQFEALITEYNALPASSSDEEKFSILQEAERLISTKPTISLPADPDHFRDDLINIKKTDYVLKRDNFNDLVNDASISLSGLRSGIQTELPVSDYDLIDLDIEDEEKQILILAEDLRNRAAGFYAQLESRLPKVNDYIDASKASSESSKKVDELLEAGKLLFGEDFKIVPEFTLPEQQADEWDNSFNDELQLLTYSKDTADIDFPVDTWMYGTARVREKMHHWENTVMLTDAFSGPELPLHPIQLPYAENDHWLGLPFPEEYTIESDRLLYTAHYAVPFDKSKRQCGLLIDEWTEVIPSKKETAGVTFHYDRPNSEPPQTILLALPSNFSGEWEWQELLDAVNETLDMAKKRAIGPTQIDTTDYARFLPSLISTVTRYPIMPMLNLAVNNLKFVEFISQEDA